MVHSLLSNGRSDDNVNKLKFKMKVKAGGSAKVVWVDETKIEKMTLNSKKFRGYIASLELGDDIKTVDDLRKMIQGASPRIQCRFIWIFQFNKPDAFKETLDQPLSYKFEEGRNAGEVAELLINHSNDPQEGLGAPFPVCFFFCNCDSALFVYVFCTCRVIR